ncbi:MAG: NAD(P)/FAD-dependent oxidoreductase [Desulfobulbus sp.]|nr:MAG: NAD(P)/FAD-dependent oxidoreductase [Desulfobulbus sp.]
MSSEDTPRGAILQRDKETYAIVPRMPAGLVSLENLKRIVNVVEKYKIPIVKITSGHRLALVGMKGEEVEPIWRDLDMDAGRAVELCLHYVQACPGNTVCKYGIQDSLAFGVEVEESFLGHELPAKLKIGVSGCPFSCAESYVRDIGLVGKKKGWTVIFGGSSSRRPRIGDVLAEDLPGDEAIRLIKRCLDYYVAHGRKQERTARFIERIGIEEFKNAVLA